MWLNMWYCSRTPYVTAKYVIACLSKAWISKLQIIIGHAEGQSQ